MGADLHRCHRSRRPTTVDGLIALRRQNKPCQTSDGVTGISRQRLVGRQLGQDLARECVDGRSRDALSRAKVASGTASVGAIACAGRR